MKRTTLAYAFLLGSLTALVACERIVTEIGSNVVSGTGSDNTGADGAGDSTSTMLAVTAIAGGSEHTCAAVDGGARCWGDNMHGRLGSGDSGAILGPTQVKGLERGVTAIAASEAHTCAIVDGGVWCWGSNGSGELGYQTEASYGAVPTQVKGLESGVTALAVGDSYSCALVAGGVWCWGTNQSGQLGNGSDQDSLVPSLVKGLERGVTTIAARSNHTCALVNAGVQCWGGNRNGLLWSGANDVNADGNIYSRVPVPVKGLEHGVAAVALGFYHVCAMVNGGVKCWGDNEHGQLGNNSMVPSSSVPVPVQGLQSGVTSIVAGYAHTCAVVDGGVQCWGFNQDGQLGDDSYENGIAPAQVEGLASGVKIVGAGYFHTCAAADGGVHCWGNNWSGQLGINDSATTASAVPVLVEF